MRNFNSLLTSTERRKLRVRRKIKKGSGYLRLSVFKSNKHFYAQLIDDNKGITLASASTLDPNLRVVCNGRVNMQSVRAVGSLMVKHLSGRDFSGKLVFDRGSYSYTGVISEFTEVLRNAGFKF